MMTVIMLAVSSCRDDLFDDVSSYGSGKSEVSAEIDFSEIVHPVSRSRAAGDAMGDINSLVVFLYRLEPGAGEDGSDIYTLYRREAVDLTKVEGDPYSTVRFKLSGVEYGNYRIYGVANMPDLADDTKFPDEELRTPYALRSVSLVWDRTSVADNNQMFGYFTTAEDQHSAGFEGDPIEIKSLKINLHAWLRRAASKVTVAVDGSELNPGVKVWIKSIQVRDIPRVCFLGRDNVPATANLIQGDKIIVAEDDTSADGDDADNIVTDALSYPRNIEDAHEPDAPSLFFYENMQGDGQLKTQVWPDQGTDPTEPKFPDGNTLGNPGYKDGKIAGTYVEVVGYYENNIGSGPIVYRFMLGKNVTDNYDAERNTHYQLTLRLKGEANNNDWHIVYDHEPDLVAVTPGYVSYLYNQSTTYSFKVVGGELIELTAEIPADSKANKWSWAPKDGEVTPEDQAAEASVGGSVYWDGAVNDPGPWNGFLALRRPRGIIYGTLEEGYTASNPATYSLNKKVFYGLPANSKDASTGSFDPQDNSVYNLGFRKYDITPGTHAEEGGEYTISNSSPLEWDISLPLYTRQLVMTAQTSYTGVNPYIAYNRQAEVVFRAKVRRRNGDVEEVSKTIEVVQSRRVVNPKAVWREATSVKPFHVQLKILPSQTSHKFENLPSDGPWRAEVVTGKDWVQLLPTPGYSREIPGENGSVAITGEGDPYDPENPGRFIDFSFKPAGPSSTPRGGIIHVYYNNYACVHTIFVRQGYDPIELYGTGVMWHSFNLLSGGDDDTPALEVDAPEEEGSYFRLHNRKYPINSASCTAPDPFKIVNRDGERFDITGPDGTVSDQMLWPDITLDPMPESWGAFKVNVNGRIEECRLPTREDLHKILDNTNTIYGYGVMYADCATETAEDVDLVYGNGHHHGGHGMRGVALCDATTGDQLFFPLAACGYGRFKQNSRTGLSGFLPPWTLGVVQYANRDQWFDSTEGYGIQYKPLFYDLFQANGTLYWLDGEYGLDINYSTLDFATNTHINLGVVVPADRDPDKTGSDAIHIRLVHDKK